MPLIALGTFSIAAGLLLGFGGGVVFASGAGAILLAAGVWKREIVLAACGVLVAMSGSVAEHTRRSDLRCTDRLVTSAQATVRLNQDLRDGQVATGITDDTCRLPVRIVTTTGVADAGSRVRVRGDAIREGAAVTFLDASVVPIAAPGFAARWRSRTGRVIDQLYGSRAPLVRALVLADEHDIAPDVRREFADAGIVHMLSVSGLHVAVLAEAVSLVLLAAGAPKRRAEAGAIGVTVAFVLFIGAPSPALRAGVMYCATVVTRWLQRPTSPWALLALGALPPLADPRAVLAPGYQLSIAGMAGLIASGHLVRRIRWPRRPAWFRRIGREVCATIIACAVTAPVVAWHFGRLSLAAPLTNLAAAPVFGLVQPALFLSLLLSPLVPLARFVADATGVLLMLIVRIAQAGAAIPGAAIDVLPSLTTALLSAVAAGSLIAVCLSRQWRKPAIAFGLSIGAALWWPAIAPSEDSIELHVIDVGQGDAIALRTPARRWIVVDAGDSWRGGDAGERTVAPYIRHRGGDVADLVLTHPHSDHIGGAASLIRLTHVGAVLEGGMPYPTSAYDSLLHVDWARYVPWRVVRAGDTLSVDGVRLRVLGPDSLTAATARDANEASVVLLAEYRGVRILLTGDAEAAEESRMRAEFGSDLHADILKVGHHGSSTSSTDLFLDAVRPRLALVSVGAGNTYGHPSPSVMRDLEGRHVLVLRTDLDGTIVVRSDGNVLRVRTDERSFELPLGRP